MLTRMDRMADAAQWPKKPMVDKRISFLKYVFVQYEIIRYEFNDPF